MSAYVNGHIILKDLDKWTKNGKQVPDILVAWVGIVLLWQSELLC